MSNLLVKMFGWRATLIHGDTMVVDRWYFLKEHMPVVKDTNEKVLEVGCGTGAFSLGLATRGYHVTGMSWDKKNQFIAEERARISKIKNVSFPVCDARHLNKEKQYQGAFDVVVCCEVIEHILDDRKLMKDLYSCLKPGGRLLLTTPNHYYRSSSNDAGPWHQIEDGGHVRRGYTTAMLRELCKDSGFEVENLSTITQVFSHNSSKIYWRMFRILDKRIAWLMTLPLRGVVFFDRWLGRMVGGVFNWPGYSLSLVAYKKRFE